MFETLVLKENKDSLEKEDEVILDDKRACSPQKENNQPNKHMQHLIATSNNAKNHIEED